MRTIFAKQSSLKLEGDMNKVICIHPSDKVINRYGCNVCTQCGHKWGGIRETDTRDSYGFPKPRGHVSSVGARHGS